MTQFNLTLLGAFRLAVGREAVNHFRSDKVRALLAYLAFEPGQAHSRRMLLGLLWPEIADQHALNNLRVTLHRLRQTLNAAVPDSSERLLTITRHTIQLNTAEVEIDVNRFQQRLAATSTHQHPNLAACPDCLVQLAEAAELYRGELLSGFGLADAPAFEEWLLLRREMLHQQALMVFTRLAETYEIQKKYDQALAYATRLVDLDPYREESHRILMRLLTRNGQPDQALAHYGRWHEQLRQEMGVAPAEETVALIEEIRSGQLSETASSLPKPNSVPPPPPSALPALPPLDVPSSGPFFGRTRELAQLQQWLTDDGCRLVAILGLGGMGKTTLAAQTARTLAHQYEVVLWRSLLNAPPLAELLPPLLQILSNQQLVETPDSLDEQLRLLLGYLRNQRVLLVLDNLESILAKEKAGAYQTGYEAYGQLIQQIATREHQSQLLLTSREQLRGYERLERDSRLVQTLQLDGLDDVSGQDLLTQRGLHSLAQEATLLIDHYSGNPLALKLVAEVIQEFYFGSVETFLNEDTPIFADIRDVLDQQFSRLSPLEQDILFWLAVSREALTIQDFRKNLISSVRQRELVEGLQALYRRSLLERNETGFFLQNVVTEYLTDSLVEQVSQEIESGDLKLFNSHALLQAQAKTCVRQSQARLILEPIAERLTAILGLVAIDQTCRRFLDHLRQEPSSATGYAAGNMLNLLLHLKIDVTGYDFSQLHVRQAYLQNTTLPGINFRGADLSDTVFTDTFGLVQALALSPDDQLLAVGTKEGEIRLWWYADRRLQQIISGHTDSLWAVAFSPDSQTLASAGQDHMIRLWDASTGRLHHVLQGHKNTIWAVAFSPDGQTLASVGQDDTIRLWDMSTGQLDDIFQQPIGLSRAVAFSPDGQMLAGGRDDYEACLWDIRTRQIRHTLPGHTDIIRCIAFSPDGQTLATGSADQTVRLWDVRSGQLRHSLQGHTAWVLSIAFSPDGQTLASGSNDETIRLWNTQTGECSHILVHSHWVFSLAFSADSQTLISGGSDYKVRLWDTRTKQLNYVLQGHTSRTRYLAFSPDGQTLATGNADSTVHLLDVSGVQTLSKTTVSSKTDEGVICGPVRHTLRGLTDWVSFVAFSPDSQTLAAGGSGQKVCLWDARTGQRHSILSGYESFIYAGAFSADGQTLITAEWDYVIRFWDFRTGHVRYSLHKDGTKLYGIALSADNRLLAAANADQTVDLWNISAIPDTIRSDQELSYQSLRGHSGFVFSVAFSPDGQTLASASADCTVRLWDTSAKLNSSRPTILSDNDDTEASTVPCRVLPGHTDRVWFVIFSPDGKLLASGSEDKTIRLWEVSTGQVRHILKGHTLWVGAIAFSPDGRILASSSGDETIKLWDVETGVCLVTWRIPGPYEGMNITDVSGITEAQRLALKALGAIEFDPG